MVWSVHGLVGLGAALPGSGILRCGPGRVGLHHKEDHVCCCPIASRSDTATAAAGWLECMMLKEKLFHGKEVKLGQHSKPTPRATPRE